MPMSPLIRRPALLDGRAMDPYFDKVSLLLPMSGADGSTSFVDKSKNALTVTPAGNAQISTAQSPFAGGSSAYFDGVNDGLTIPATNLLEFGTGAFTVEAWLYITAAPSSIAQVVGRHQSNVNADWLVYVRANRGLTLYLGNSGGLTLDGSSIIPLNTWTHIAVARQVNTCYVFINGALDVSASFAGSSENGTGGTFNIAADQNNDQVNFTGYISSLRVTKGIARYTSNFTPPTRRFPTV